MSVTTDLGVVVIGRNEGNRLLACLASLRDAGACVYVDSGSTDGSPQRARELGFDVVELPVPPGFTAARARNAGVRRLRELAPHLRYVQMVDGDCEVAAGWLAAARARLEADPGLAGVFGRRRERFPDASIYNMLCDDEWDVPLGPASAFGGDVMIRLEALAGAGGYTNALIAGEELDLCLRLRGQGWRIERLDAEMTLHDVALSRFSQWWRRAERGGHAFAELAFRHRTRSDPSWIRELASIVAWAALAVAAAAALLVGLAFAMPLLVWASALFAGLIALQAVRLARRRHADGMPVASALSWTMLIMVGKFAQVAGIARFCRNIAIGTAPSLIEYKG